MKLSFLFTSSLLILGSTIASAADVEESSSITLEESASSFKTVELDSSVQKIDREEEEERELQLSHDDPVPYFNWYTDKDDWTRCNIINVTDGCLPTVSIEEAACRAELIVYGTVIAKNSAGDRKISVNWRSYVFDEPKQTVPKWGAGLDNSKEANTTFSNDSGEFHTWVTGFDEGNCGTKPPLDDISAYFFLEGLPENKGKEVTLDGLKDLNVNFKLATSAFGSGVAYLEDWQYVKNYRFGTSGCDRVACCYKPDCTSCTETDFSKCDFTTYVAPVSGASARTSSALFVMGVAMMIGSLFVSATL